MPRMFSRAATARAPWELGSFRPDQGSLTVDGDIHHAFAAIPDAPAAARRGRIPGGIVDDRGGPIGRGGGRQGVSATEESAAGRNGQEDRGHRILLVRVSPLRRSRTDSAGMDEDDA